MDPKELIAALGIFADPNASDEDRAAALDKLTAYFNSLLDSQGSGATEGASEAGDGESKDPKTETSSETGDDKPKDEPSKEMASALAQIKSLTDRVAKMEKASAVGSAPRRKEPTVIERKEPVAPVDPVSRMIDDAVATSRRNAGNRNAGK